MQADQTLNVSKKVDGKPSLERVNGRGVCGFKTMPPQPRRLPDYNTANDTRATQACGIQLEVSWKVFALSHCSRYHQHKHRLFKDSFKRRQGPWDKRPLIAVQTSQLPRRESATVRAHYCRRGAVAGYVFLITNHWQD